MTRCCFGHQTWSPMWTLLIVTGTKTRFEATRGVAAIRGAPPTVGTGVGVVLDATAGVELGIVVGVLAATGVGLGLVASIRLGAGVATINGD